MVLFGLIAGILAFGAIITILRGFVLAHLWGWFLVPLGAPAIGVALAIGISLIATLLTHQVTPKKADEKKLRDKLSALGEGVGFAIISPMITLGIGAIVVNFI